MKTISKQLDASLARLAWSLWTGLGVAGFEKKHQEYSIAPEELLLLTSVLSDYDPRLRDEALDWCTKYHRFISPARLQILAKKYQAYIAEPFSAFASTINAACKLRTKWVVLKKTLPLQFRPSRKSKLSDFEAPCMIHFRLRSFLTVSARADVLAFLLRKAGRDFTASDLTELGFSKRRIADILDDLAAAGILHKSQVRNQFRYSFVKRAQFIKVIGGIPKKMVCWQQILEILLPIRKCLNDVEEATIGVRVVDMRTLLHSLSQQLEQLKVNPPPIQSDYEAYWNAVTKWILAFSEALSEGTF